MYLKIIFILTNSSYPDEMQHFAALHLGLRCLSKYSLRSQMVKHPCTAKDGKAKQGSPVWQDQTESPGLANSRSIYRRGPYSFRILPWYYVANRQLP